jgi:hypothetical protein
VHASATSASRLSAPTRASTRVQGIGILKLVDQDAQRPHYRARDRPPSLPPATKLLPRQRTARLARIELDENEKPKIDEEVADLTEDARLHLWTDRSAITHPVLGRTLEVLQNLARKARRTTPYQIIAEAIEELNIRPILRSRYGVTP